MNPRNTIRGIGRDVITSAAASLTMRAAAMMLNFALTLLVARLLGVADSGLLFSALALATIVAVPARIGLDTTLVRLGSPLWVRGAGPRLAALWRRALVLTLSAGTAASAMFYLAGPGIATIFFQRPELAGALQDIALSTLPLALISVNAGALKMLGRPALASGYEAGASALVFLLFAAILHIVGQPLELNGFAGAFTASTAVAALAGLLKVAQEMPAPRRQTRAPGLVADSMPILGIDLINVILAVGLLPLVALVGGAQDSGVFNAALRLTAPLAVVFLVLSNVFSARLATALERGDHGQAASLCRSFRIVGLALVVPAALALSWLDEIPSILFGAQFATAASLIPIMSLGHVLAMATGPVGLVLIHAGRARRLRTISLWTVAVSLPLTAALCLVDGARGAATGFAVSVVLPRWLAYRALRDVQDATPRRARRVAAACVRAEAVAP